MTTIVTRTGKGSPLTHVEVDTNFTNLNTAKLETAAIPLGTAAAPSVSFLSDANTGIYSPGADQLAVATNGTVRLTTSTTAISSTLPIDVPLGAVGTPSFTFTGDLNTGIYSPAADTLALVTAGNNRLHITSGGLVGIGTSTPDALLTVNGIGAFGAGAVGTPSISATGDLNTGFWFPAADTIAASTAGTERMRIISTGDVLIGTTSVDVHNSSTLNGIVLRPSLSGGFFGISRADGGLLAINRTGSDGDLVYFNQDGTSEGTISVSGTTVSYNGAHLSRWSQLASGAERTEILRGSILSNLDEMCEWIDAPKEAVLWQEEEELPEGIDVGDIKEPAVESGLQENEQLNRMKVSVVEGDKNVSGVFQCWDDDDNTYTNDFYCAMTGDFIIRIADGVTVERGDLLMSAGDGTAKPQADDIIRSKTVAKVTSTNVSCTYADGSYCVPCVLMAC